MDVQICGNRYIDRLQKPQELSSAMASLELPDDLAGGHIQRREQRYGAVPFVIVGGCAAGLPKVNGIPGCVRFNAWI